jgi:cobalt-zinc-cadmium efflux system protein
MAFGIVLLAASWEIIRDSLSIPTEGAPKGVDLNAVAVVLLGLPGVSGIRHTHAWTLTSNKNVFCGHIRTDERSRDGNSGTSPSSAARSVRLLFFHH